MDEQTLRDMGAEVIGGPQFEYVTPVGEVPIIYTNNIELHASVFDVALLLGVNVGSREQRQLIRPLARMVMSPQHAKALFNVLQNHIRVYEAAFGHIPEAARVNASPTAPEPPSGPTPASVPE